MSAAILHLESVSAGYKAVPTIRGISLTMMAGEAVAIIGANGAGKTTLLRTIMGQIALMDGSICFRAAPSPGFEPINGRGWESDMPPKGGSSFSP